MFQYFAIFLSLAVVGGLSQSAAAQATKSIPGMLLPQTESNYQAHPYQGKLTPDDGQWVRPAKDYASTRICDSNSKLSTNSPRSTKIWEHGAIFGIRMGTITVSSGV
jgi:hypothetical protein